MQNDYLVKENDTIKFALSKTNETFDWKTEINLEDGVKNTIEYYKEYGISETFTHLTNDKK